MIKFHVIPQRFDFKYKGMYIESYSLLCHMEITLVNAWKVVVLLLVKKIYQPQCNE